MALIVAEQHPSIHLTRADISRFRKTVLNYYRHYARDLPWRQTDNPYYILVSEIMLQQTQVDRVIDKYVTFIKAFPSVKSLAESHFSDVLKLWHGLGYNRRAKYLYECARSINEIHSGTVPQEYDQLVRLPGIGSYTASAVCVFAFNRPLVFIETNIRTVFIYYFFNDHQSVSDKQLFPLVETTLYHKNPSLWYNALMDYGVYLKKMYGNPARKSAHYIRQSPFKGSDRQVRGMILNLLIEQRTCTLHDITGVTRDSEIPDKKLNEIIAQLEREGLIRKSGRKYCIAD